MPTPCYSVQLNGSWGYIDPSGTLILKPQWDQAISFEGAYGCVMKAGRYGAINHQGELVIPLLFEWPFHFREGLAAVMHDDMKGFIDCSGQFVIPPTYTFALEFSEGLAAVAVGEFPDIQFGFIDRHNDFVITPKYEDVRPFSEGVAAVCEGGQWGYIDRTGIPVIEPRFFYADPFVQGLACVTLHNRTIGVIDRAGAFITEQRYDASLRQYSEGLLGVAVGTWRDEFQGRWGFIDRTGELVIPLVFEAVQTGVGPFQEGVAPVQVGGLRGQWGFIDHTGELVIAPKFEYAAPFTGGCAKVMSSVDQPAASGYINHQGTYIWYPTR